MLEVGEGEGGGSDGEEREGGGGVGEGDVVVEREGGASIVRGRVPLEGGFEAHEAHHSWVQWHCGRNCMRSGTYKTGLLPCSSF